MISRLFRPLSVFEEVPPADFPGLAAFSPVAPPPGSWTAPNGGPARNSRSADPLVHDQWTLQWEAPLGEAADPSSLLVGRGRVVVTGAERRGLWEAADGRNLAVTPRPVGTSFLDVDGERLLISDQGGLTLYSLDGQRQASQLLSFAADGSVREILAGPDALVFLNLARPAHGAPEAAVSTFRVVDYTRIKNELLYGLVPLAGIVREDAVVTAAAGKDGPVLATQEGLLWCDWQLRARHEFLQDGDPLGLSIDDGDRAYLLVDHLGEVRFRIVPPGGPAASELRLPGRDFARPQPPIIAPTGQAYLTARNQLMAVSPEGEVLWRQDRSSAAPGSISRNGLLLIADDRALFAVTPDGRRLPLWLAPAPIVTAPVLAGERLYLASAQTLYALRPTLP